jgi:hypothetical protein
MAQGTREKGATRILVLRCDHGVMANTVPLSAGPPALVVP